MIYLIRIFLIIFFFSTNINSNELENKVLFKVNNKVFTQIDLEKRIQYITIINNINILEINDNNKYEILDDFINSLLFYEYYLERKIKDPNLDNEVINFYNTQLSESIKNNNTNENTKNNILENIKIDLIRKKIVENLVNKQINLIENTNDKLIYNYRINYIVIDNGLIDLTNLNKIKLKKDFNNFIEKLKDKNISYYSKNEEIIDHSKISNELKQMINNNETISIKIENNYVSITFIEKDLLSYDGIFVTLYNIQSNQEFNKNNLNCNYIKNLKNKQTYKEYEYSKLNQEIKNNLKSLNDYIIIKNTSNGEVTYNYIFLCELKYDEKILKNLKFNKKVNSLVDKIQNNFISIHKKKYNLLISDE